MVDDNFIFWLFQFIKRMMNTCIRIASLKFVKNKKFEEYMLLQSFKSTDFSCGGTECTYFPHIKGDSALYFS